MNPKENNFFASKHRFGEPIADQEMRRILSLPIRHQINEDDAELFSAERMRPEAYFNTTWRINPIQVAMCREYIKEGGVFAPVGVGWGKTFATFLIANEAFLRGVKKILYLIPASAAEQTARQQEPLAREKIWLSVPVTYLSGMSSSARLSKARSGGAGLYVMNYQQLSRPDSNDVLAAIMPELIIADEAHKLKNRGAALTKRVFALLEEFKPQFVTMSGTFSNKSIKQFHHQLRAALGDKAPVPKTLAMCDSWAEHIDADAFGNVPHIPVELQPLVGWAKMSFPGETFNKDTTSMRKAFRLRLNSAPGVVASIGESVSASLTIENHPIPELEKAPGWDKIRELEKGVLLGQSPEGDVLAHAMHGYKWRKELSAGFYYSLRWPDTDHLLRYRMAKSADEAAERIAKSQEWHRLDQIYQKLLRAFLKVSPLGLDQPLQVVNSIEQHGDRFVPKELVAAFFDRRAADFEGRLERLGTPVYVSDARYPALLKWVKERPKDDPGGLVWYANTAVGKRAFEFLQKEGVDVIYCPGGSEHNIAIIDPVHRNRICIASSKAHNEVKNLQHWGDQYHLQPARDASVAEQSIGRTHRMGQERDEITVTLNLTTDFDHEEWAAVINDSLFAQQNLGQRRRVIIATYNPMPKIFSPEYLQEKGYQPHMLNSEQRKMLQSYYGHFADAK